VERWGQQRRLLFERRSRVAVDIGQPKVDSAATAMRALNPDLRIDTLKLRADAALLNRLLPTAQVVLDCCDNFETRQAVNAACVAHRVPLVSGAVIRMDGQLAVYDSRDPASPCYACLFPPDEAPEEVRCATLGVLAPLVGVIGTLQATEAVKLLAGIGSALPGRLQMLDGRRLEWSEMRFARQPACPVCGSGHAP
jgi:molybdopterin/thiamine biosynthesis adenylyltransferase